MKTLASIIISCAVLNIGNLFGQEAQAQSNHCPCKDCKCSTYSHCGCHTNKGCSCDKTHSCCNQESGS